MLDDKQSMKLLIINGPNINMLGIREPEMYGSKTYDDLCVFIKTTAKENNIQAEIFQSNHEGEIVDIIQDARGKYDGIIINAAAYTHTSIAILDALKATAIPTVEVHMTDVTKREKFRRFSYLSLYCKKTIVGKGFGSYSQAINYLKKNK